MLNYLKQIFVDFVFTGALQITESDVKDQGKYECVANNSVGTEYSKSTILYVKGMSRLIAINVCLRNVM